MNTRAAIAAGLAILIVLPFLATSYVLHVAIVVLLNVTYAAALYAVLRMGYLSLGHAGFIALGAYASVILSVRLGVSPWLGIPAGGLVAGLFGWGLGALTLRLRGIYFALAIFAFGEIVTAIFRAFDWFGGPAGIASVPRPTIRMVRGEGAGYSSARRTRPRIRITIETANGASFGFMNMCP